MNEYDLNPNIPSGSRPVERTRINGVPVYHFGYASFYAESPKLVDDDQVQEGNDCQPVKIHPKKSWEIKSNRLGATPPRMPRTPANDFQPLECINLIDGQAETCWSSNRHTRPDETPAWMWHWTGKTIGGAPCFCKIGNHQLYGS